MISLPIPVIVSLLLVLIAVGNSRRLNATATGRVFAAVLYLNAVSMALIGVRWSLGIVEVLPVVATLSVVNSILLYLAFRSLGQSGPVISVSRDWRHALPVVLIGLMAWLRPHWLDIPLACWCDWRGERLTHCNLCV